MDLAPQTLNSLPHQEEIKPQYYTVGIFDTDGILRGKRMHCDKYESSLKDGFGFCDVIFGWDIEDKLYENTSLTGWHTGFGDLTVKLDPATERKVPYEPQTKLVIGQADGPLKNICPRNVLNRVIQRGLDLGVQFKTAFEYEFFVFDETPDSIRAKNYKNLTPLTPGSFGYSVLRGSVKQSFHESLWALCQEMNFPLEALHTETGPGVIEAALCKSAPCEAADRASLFKTYTKILAQQQDLMATFMARWSKDVPGQSGHIHISATDMDSNPLFHKDNALSPTMAYFIGGIQKLMPEITAVFAPTINSYTRLVPGFWAPTNANWGIENRTTAIRAILGKPSASRVEFRASGADANPYLALAAILAAGLHGIENKIKPTEATTGNGYETQDKSQPLPTHLLEACSLLKSSDVMKDYLSSDFIDHFVKTREWEFQKANENITDWQLERYFESI